jgi:cytoskeleton protein RodZ
MTDERGRALGEDLAEQRRARGVTLEDMSRDTKIRRTILESIENGRFEELPPDVFVVGFIKAYSRRLEVDPEPFLARFMKLKQAEPELAREAGRSPADQGRNSAGWMVGAIILVLLAAMLAGALWWLGLLPFDSNPGIPSPPVPRQEQNALPAVPPESAKVPGLHEAAQANGAPEADNAPSSTVPGPPVEASPAGGSSGGATAARAGKGDLVITCLRPCWLGLWADGERKVYRLLSPGEKLSFDGEKFKANIGNAAGLEVVFKGRIVKLPTGEGRVVKDFPIPGPKAEESGQ